MNYTCIDCELKCLWVLNSWQRPQLAMVCIDVHVGWCIDDELSIFVNKKNCNHLDEMTYTVHIKLKRCALEYESRISHWLFSSSKRSRWFQKTFWKTWMTWEDSCYSSLDQTEVQIDVLQIKNYQWMRKNGTTTCVFETESEWILIVVPGTPCFFTLNTVFIHSTLMFLNTVWLDCIKNGARRLKWFVYTMFWRTGFPARGPTQSTELML